MRMPQYQVFVVSRFSVHDEEPVGRPFHAQKKEVLREIGRSRTMRRIRPGKPQVFVIYEVRGNGRWRTEVDAFLG